MIDLELNTYLSRLTCVGELSGASVIVRRGDEVLYDEHFGYADVAAGKEITKDSIYRIMSMTKCITAVAVMICVERGLLTLDTPVSRYIPSFANMPVMDDARYAFSKEKMKKLPVLLLTFSMKRVKRKPSQREITVRDLLSHSSGLQQGLVGLLDMLSDKHRYKSMEARIAHYAGNVLDFEPGTGTGYSPVAGFDLLTYLVSTVTGERFEDFVQREICFPLGMKDTTFFLNDEQKSRLVRVYKRKKDRLVDVTGTGDDLGGFYREKEMTYEHGSGGMYSTAADYDRFGHMLLNGGELDGVRILKPETVSLMHTEAPEKHLEPDPGFVWGLGMKIRQDPSKSNCKATAGTYGWSGAFGTHFFISPDDNLECVFMTNRSDLNGSGSYVSAKIEELVFATRGKNHDGN